jgi:NAD(P)-dependent dehydrogenase (short-subunit alcohol dehydrogenase family)
MSVLDRFRLDGKVCVVTGASQADVLVNNAHAKGATPDIDSLSVTDENWEQVFNTNILGPYRLISALGRKMRLGRGGSIINILSGSGFLPNPGNLTYGVSKSALWMMTRYLASECAPDIRVNALIPGVILSETGGPGLTARIEEVFMPQIPMKRAGHPTEVAAAAVYLASDAASYTTGTVLFVNGGRPW